MPPSPATGNWGGSSTAVTTQSKNVAAAAKFATWLNTDPEAVKALVEVAGIYPADTDGAKTALTKAPEFFSNQPDFYDVVGEAAQNVASVHLRPQRQRRLQRLQRPVRQGRPGRSQERLPGRRGTACSRSPSTT